MLETDLLLKHMSDAVLTLDENFVLRQLNDRAALLYRRSAAELVGRSLVDHFPELAATDALDQLSRARAGRLPRRLEMFIPASASYRRHREDLMAPGRCFQQNSACLVSIRSTRGDFP